MRLGEVENSERFLNVSLFQGISKVSPQVSQRRD